MKTDVDGTFHNLSRNRFDLYEIGKNLFHFLSTLILAIDFDISHTAIEKPNNDSNCDTRFFSKLVVLFSSHFQKIGTRVWQISLQLHSTFIPINFKSYKTSLLLDQLQR